MPRNLLAVFQGVIKYRIASCMSAFPEKRKAGKIHRLQKSENSAQYHKRRKVEEFPLKVNPLAMDTSESCSSFAAKVKHLSLPTKSENDKKEYRVLQLPNGMRVLLISDPSVSESEPKPASNGVDNMGYSSAGEESCSDEGSESDHESEGDEADDSDGHSEDEESEPEPDSTEASTADSQTASRKGALKEGDRMAAASLSVNVGSFSDPADLPGLAHFLEHMVFMGSTKYPQENAFDEYLKIYGGGSNASTDCETTTFEFEIHQRYFQEALGIFTQFFAAPLLLPESMKREKEAIDSEFQMALPSDSCRRQQLIGHLAIPAHPMGKFMWGNSDTLKLDNDPEGVELNRRVRAFWQEHYTADRMTAVLQSKHSLDQLEEWATTIFRDIPSKNSEPASSYCFRALGAPFDTPNFRKIIKIVPVKDVNQVCLTWALPSQLMHYRIKPLGYLSWLIGHEGKGSLLAYLRKKVWALDLASGNDESGFEHNSTYASFGINISLTEKGMAEIDQVIHAVFLYIGMLQEKGPEERIWNEIKAIEELSFRYVEDVPPVENVETLSENMHKFDPADYITGESLLFEFNHQVIANCVNALKVDNVNIMISSKEFERANLCSETEPWFQTKYSSSDIPSQWIELWSTKPAGESPFAVPETNQYLASDFSLIEVDGSTMPDYPVRVDIPEDGFWLWHRPDVKFRIPKAVLSYYLVSPVACESPKNAVLLELLGKILRHQLMEKVYDALVAQLELAINHYDRGLIIKVNGFNHKLHLLVQTIVDQFAKFEDEVDAEVFNALREQQEKGYRNYCLKPSKLINDARLTLLHTAHWSVLEKSNAVKDVTLSDMKEFSKRLKETFRLECLCQGNYTAQQALEVTRQLKEKLQPESPAVNTLLPIRICQVPVGNKTCRIASFHPSDANSVVVNYYQVGATNMHQTAVMEVLVNLMEEPVFDVLRTREQLGYNVYVTLRNTFGVLGFSITVDFQADKFSATHVDERIEEFLRQFESRLNGMTEDDLQTRVLSLIKLKQVPDVSLDEEVSRNWNELLNEEYLFDRLRLEVEHLPLVTLDELRTFFRRYAIITPDGERRKLSMQVIGSDKKGNTSTDYQPSELRFLCDEDRDFEFIRDLNEFRRSTAVFPPLRTFDGLPTTSADDKNINCDSNVES